MHRQRAGVNGHGRHDLPVTQRGTKTSAFGTSQRVNHDATTYYERNLTPLWHTGETDAPYEPENELPPDVANTIFNSSSEDMSAIPDCSVHLMVTSPPYNVGKQYDDQLSVDDHMSLIAAVLAETHRVLVSGGRACVNIANIGRKPYIPLHAYIIQAASEIGFLMRGEIIWDKGMSGQSTAWGSWRSPANPTLRDTHEYILVFQKPPFGRRKPDNREPTISRDDFLELTKSVWTFPAMSAKRANHPAPFPVELPRRLIQLYTYSGEIVLDPFMGSGATAIAAVESGRAYVGYELEQDYIDTAMSRVNQFQATLHP